MRKATTGRRTGAGHVAVIGVGGLGCPAALGLADAGVGTITLIDPDRVELSNLPRQILYSDADVGRAKVACASAALRSRYPGTEVRAQETALTADSAAALLIGADFVIDATDGIATKLLINDLAVRAGHVFCHAGVVGFRGQLLTVMPGRTPCVRCVFPDVAREEESGSCSGAGVVGPIAGLIGALQASHALSYLAGDHEIAGQLLTYDGLVDRWLEFPARALRRCTVCASLQPDAATAGGAAQ
jgi:molybdopterin/thiamine biosynthesis adenylyltransferase